jgi:hypothetical protein
MSNQNQDAEIQDRLKRIEKVEENFKKQQQLEDKNTQQAKKAVEAGIEKGFLLTDEQLDRAVSFIALNLRQFNNSNDIPPLIFISLYKSEEELQELKDQAAKQNGMSVYELDAFFKSENVDFMPIMLLNPSQKDFDRRHDWLYELGNNFNDQPNAIFMATECWYVDVPEDKKEWDEDDVKYYERKITPSQHPRRQEAVLVTGLTLDSRTSGKFFPIDRTPEGKMIIGPEMTKYRQSKDVSVKNVLLESFFRGYAAKLVGKYGLKSKEEIEQKLRDEGMEF